MWSKTFSKSYKNITKEKVWDIWSNVEQWPAWDNDLDYCEMKGAFEAGSEFILKPKSGPKVKITLSEVVPHKQFTDYCRFPGAKMFDYHELADTPDGLRITNTVTVKGPLAFLWIMLVAKGIVKSIPKQTDNLVAYGRLNHV